MKSSLSKRALAFFTATFLQAALTFGAVTITTPPAALTTVPDGAKITLTVVATSSLSNPLIYTWKKRGMPDTVVKADSTSNQFVIASAKATDAGSYYVTVRETQTNDTDDSAPDSVVVVNVRPKITVKPLSPATPITEGGSVSFNVTLDASGTPPFTYTWQKKNGAVYTQVAQSGPKPDLTDTFTLNNVQLAAAGSYRVSITNASGIVVNSADVLLKVNSRPVITTQPVPALNVVFGLSGILKVVVGGNSPFKYQWYKNGILIPKATAASLSVKGTDNAANGVAEGPGTYKVRITNAFTPDLGLPSEAFTESADAVVRVVHKPKIITQPQKATIDITGVAPVNHSLNVVMDTTGDEGTISYQWYKDNKIIPGATSDTLNFTPMTWADRGSYKVVIKTMAGTQTIGTVTSASAVLTVLSPPIITSQSPAEIFGATKGSVKLFVIATGTTPLIYEWRFRPVGTATYNPTIIGKAAALTLSALSNANRQGHYQCTVKNAPKGATAGSVNSAEIYVQADDPPKITQQTTVLPYNATPGLKATVKIPVGDGNNKLHLMVTVIGTNRLVDDGNLKANPLVFKWLKNGVVIPGATTNELIINNVAAGDTGKYSCEISNNVAKVVSTALAITVSGPPVITGQPAPAGGIEESKVETTVTATGGSPTLRYQWEKDAGGGAWQKLTGKTASKLTFTSVLITDDGIYRCVVTNDYGSTNSNTVQIIVTPIPPPAPGAVPGTSTVEFYPEVARAGEKVRIYGQSLNYIESVKFGTSAGTFVVESPNSILVTVPGGAATTLTPITLKNRKNATVVNTVSGFRRTTIFENALYVRPQQFRAIDPINPLYTDNMPTIISVSSGSVSMAGNSSSFAGFVGYELLVPRVSVIDFYLTSDYDFQTGLQTDPDMAVHLDTTSTAPLSTMLGPDGVTRFPSTPTQRAFLLGDDFMSITTTRANQRVLLAVDPGLTAFGWSGSGPFTFSAIITPVTTTSNVTNQTSEISGHWTLVGDKASLSGDSDSSDASASIQFGGQAASATEPIVLWHQLDGAPLNGPVVSSFTMSLEPGDENGDDQFAWQVSDPEGNPLIALWVNSADGTLRAVQPDGTTTTSTQHITPGGGAHRFEIVVDPAAGTWITMMDGVPVTAAIKLPTGAKFGDISAVWDLGADGVSSGASIIFDDFRVEAEVAP